MKPTTQLLPGIIFVGAIDCSLLQPSLQLQAIAGMDVAVQTAVLPLAIAKDATASCLTEKENGNTRQTASLKFRTTDPLPLHWRLGFVVTDVTGQSYLVGSRERPYPQVKATRQFGTPGGDPNCWEVEVTHLAMRTLIPCVY